MWIWSQLCENANTVIDIGANTGLYRLLTKSINEKCTVIAFEPSKSTFNRLQKNVTINNFSIQTENIAGSEKES